MRAAGPGMQFDFVGIGGGAASSGGDAVDGGTVPDSDVDAVAAVGTATPVASDEDEEPDDAATAEGKGKGKGKAKAKAPAPPPAKANGKGKGKAKAKPVPKAKGVPKAADPLESLFSNGGGDCGGAAAKANGKGEHKREGKGKATGKVYVGEAEAGSLVAAVEAEAVGGGIVVPEADVGEAEDDGGDDALLPPVATTAKAKPKAKAKSDGGATAKCKAKGKATGKAKGKAMPKARAGAEADAELDGEGGGGAAVVVVVEPPPASNTPGSASAVSGPFDSTSVMCDSCNRFFPFAKCRVISKGRNTWRCSGCGVKAAQLRRVFGSWPSEQFSLLSQERNDYHP
jgi:hypothetical protein